MANSTNAQLKWAYLGLGSNLQDPKQQITVAVEEISRYPQTQVQQVSSLYQTQAVGPIAQEDFINAVVAVRTALPPIALLESCLALEKKQGRIREHRWGPRIIDCDILWMENTVLNQPGLTLPHPEMAQRLFVLVPLAELVSDFLLTPQLKIRDQIAVLQQQGQQRIKKIPSA